MGLIQTKNDENRKLAKTQYDLNGANGKKHYFCYYFFLLFFSLRRNWVLTL